MRYLPKRYVSPELAEEFQDEINFLRRLEKIAERDEERKKLNRNHQPNNPSQDYSNKENP